VLDKLVDMTFRIKSLMVLLLLVGINGSKTEKNAKLDCRHKKFVE